MFLVYCDESGDVGTLNSPSKYFVLSGIVIHELKWKQMLDEMIQFRSDLKKKYGLLLKEEIHASVFINGVPRLRNGAHRNDRLRLLTDCLDFLNSRDYISIITVRCNKSKRKDKDEVFFRTWNYFVQRIENTVKFKNFSTPNPNDTAILVPDQGNTATIRGIIRKMRKYNPISNKTSYGPGSRMIEVKHVIKDPVFRDSKDSYFHQMADVVAYFARQYYEPNNFIKRKGAKKYYVSKLGSVTNKFATTAITPNNIVEM